MADTMCPPFPNSDERENLITSQAQEAILQFLVSLEHACELGRNGRDIGVMHAPCCHALMLCVQQDGDTSWAQRFGDAISDLCGHRLLRLQALAEDFHDARQF